MISKPETVDGVPLDLLGGEPGSRGRVHDAAQAFSPMRASSQQHAPGSARADGLHDRTTATHRERIGSRTGGASRAPGGASRAPGGAHRAAIETTDATAIHPA